MSSNRIRIVVAAALCTVTAAAASAATPAPLPQAFMVPASRIAVSAPMVSARADALDLRSGRSAALDAVRRDATGR